MNEEELTLELVKLYQSGVRAGVEMSVRSLRKALDEVLTDLEDNMPEPPEPPEGFSLKVVE